MHLQLFGRSQMLSNTSLWEREKGEDEDETEMQKSWCPAEKQWTTLLRQWWTMTNNLEYCGLVSVGAHMLKP